MKAIVQITGVALIGLALAGCSDGSSSSRNDGPDVVQSEDFTQFVKGEMDNTSVSREAVNINDRKFSFNDQDNEQAFDELF